MSKDSETGKPLGLAHLSYDISLALKALIGLGQLLSAIALWLTPTEAIRRLVTGLTGQELSDDPADVVASMLLQAASSLSVSMQSFYVLYLGAHAALNLGVVACLIARLHWAYPVSIAVLLLFVGYQAYEFHVSGSFVMVLLSVFDLVIAGLVWIEWRRVQASGNW